MILKNEADEAHSYFTYRLHIIPYRRIGHINVVIAHKGMERYLYNSVIYKCTHPISVLSPSKFVSNHPTTHTPIYPYGTVAAVTAVPVYGCNGWQLHYFIGCNDWQLHYFIGCNGWQLHYFIYFIVSSRERKLSSSDW
jgi:hypothetical protein